MAVGVRDAAPATAQAAQLSKLPTKGSVRPVSGGSSELALSVATAMAFAAYTYGQNVSATPAGGAPATGEFYSECSYALPAVVTSAYLLMVYIGPQLMEGREAFSMKGAMLVYNAFQTAFNVFTVGLFIMEVRASGMRIMGNMVGPEWVSEPRYGRLIWGIWLHYNNKVRAAIQPGVCVRSQPGLALDATGGCQLAAAGLKHTMRMCKPADTALHATGRCCTRSPRVLVESRPPVRKAAPKLRCGSSCV